MDEADYQALQGQDAAYKASVKQLEDAKAQLDAIIADLAAGKVEVAPSSFAEARTTVDGAITLINSGLNAIRRTANNEGVRPNAITAGGLMAIFKAAVANIDVPGYDFTSNNAAENPFAGIALALSNQNGAGTFSTTAPGLVNGNRDQRIQFALTSAVIASNAALAQLSKIPEGAILDATNAQSQAVGIILHNLEAARTNLLAIQRLISSGPTFNGSNAVQLSAKAGIRIPLVVNGTEGNVDRTVQVVDSTFPISTNVLTFSRSGQGGRTTASVSSIANGRDRISLGAITIMENRARVLPTKFDNFDDHAVFELVAPSGFRWARPVTTGENPAVRVTPEGGILEVANPDVRYTPNTDQTVLTVTYQALDRGVTTGLTNGQSRLAGGLTISGLVLLSDNPDVTLNRELEVQIRNVSGSNYVDNQMLRVAETRDFSITVTGSDNTILNGRIGTDTNRGPANARITIAEDLANSFASGRELVITLPSQVRVRSLSFAGNVNRPGFNPGNVYFNDHGQYVNSQLRPGNDENVRINDNVIRIRNLETPSGTGTLHIDLWLNIEAGFEGDIEATVSGSFLASDVNTDTVVIGQAMNPVSIEAEVRRVRLGQQFTPIADFAITENRAGAIRQGDMYVSIVDEFLTELHIGPNFQAAVTEGNLGVRNILTSNNNGGFGTGLNWRQGSNIIVEVSHDSSTASTIEFKNVMVRLAPTSPEPTANQNYSVMVWGPAVVDNFEGLRPTTDNRITLNDYFRTPGISKVLLQAATSSLSNVASLTVGSQVILVNGQQMGMDVEPFINAESESLMIPVRFVAMALGLEPGRVLWDTPRATVTVDAGTGRIVQFVIGKDTMLVNGIEIPMLNALGKPVKAEIKDGRAFIPFRALAEALDVYVSWDAATATATFDATRPAERSFHLEDLVTALPAELPVEAVTLPAEVPAA